MDGRSAGAHLPVSAGIAELGRDDDPTSFFHRVDQALYRAKGSAREGRRSGRTRRVERSVLGPLDEAG